MLEYNQLVEDAGEEHPSHILLFRSMIELAEKIQPVQFIMAVGIAEVVIVIGLQPLSPPSHIRNQG